MRQREARVLILPELKRLKEHFVQCAGALCALGLLL